MMSVYIPLFNSTVHFSYGSITGRLGQVGTGWDNLGHAGREAGTIELRDGLAGTYFGLFSLSESVLDKILYTPGSDDYTRILTGVS